MTELLSDKLGIKEAELPSKFVKEIEYLNGKNDGWYRADKLEQKPVFSDVPGSNLNKYGNDLPGNDLPGNDSSARALPSMTIVDNAAGEAPIGRTANGKPLTDFARTDTGAADIVDADTEVQLPGLITHNPERMELSTAIINDIITGGTADTYKEQIAALSSTDRLTLAKDLHTAASEYNQLRGLKPGVDKDALVVDVRVGKEDEYVNDIDIMRGFSSQEEPERVLERIDLYDPGFWTGLRGKGRAVDEKQALDAITAPYEKISALNKERTIAYWNTRTLDNPNDRRGKETDISLSWVRADIVMEKDYLNQWEPGKYEPLKENLIANSSNPDSVLQTDNTSPLFPESSRIARNELRPSTRAEEAISNLENWFRSSQ